MTPVFPSVIDSTMLTAFRSCPQKFFLSFCNNLHSRRSIDLHFGGCFASAMEAARRAYFIDGVPREEAVLRAQRVAIESWGDYPSDDTLAKNVQSLVFLIDAYFQKWPLGLDSLTPALQHHSFESTFALLLPQKHPVNNEPLLFGGRIDYFATLNDALYIVDEKTAGAKINGNVAAAYVLRSQFLGYMFAARELHLNPVGVLVRRATILKTQHELYQHPVPLLPHLITRFYTELISTVDDMLLAWDKGFAYNLGETCTAYGGCAFIPVCSAQNPEDWYSLFTRRVWNPLSRNPEGTTRFTQSELPMVIID